jgi:hypothetical protein
MCVRIGSVCSRVVLLFIVVRCGACGRVTLCVEVPAAGSMRLIIPYEFVVFVRCIALRCVAYCSAYELAHPWAGDPWLVSNGWRLGAPPPAFGLLGHDDVRDDAVDAVDDAVLRHDVGQHHLAPRSHPGPSHSSLTGLKRDGWRGNLYRLWGARVGGQGGSLVPPHTR